MKSTKLHMGFTLIELIVAITIFGIIMVSVLSIFVFSSQMSSRVELHRVLQENIKNIVENIAEEVRVGDIEDVSLNPLDICSGTPSFPDVGTKLCLAGGIEYMLGYRVSGNWVRVTDISQCSDGIEDDDSICRVLKNEGTGYFPLTSSLVAVESLTFTVTNQKLPKVMVHISVRPAYRKGLSSTMIDTHTFYVQTTVSERFIETQ